MTLDGADRLAIERRLATLEEAVRNGFGRADDAHARIDSKLDLQNGRVRRNEDWRHTHEQEHETRDEISKRTLTLLSIIIAMIGAGSAVGGLIVGILVR